MILKWIKIVCFSIVLIALQVWSMSNINLFHVATPFIYTAILLLLPINTTKVGSITWAFVVGMVIDLLMMTPGLHSSSFTIVGFLRPYILSPLVDEDVNKYNSPTWKTLQGRSLIFLTILVFLNVTLLLLIDSMHNLYFPFFIIRWITSIVFTWILCWIVMFAFDFRSKSIKANG